MFGLPFDSWLLIAAASLLGPALVRRFVLVQRRHDDATSSDTRSREAN